VSFIEMGGTDWVGVKAEGDGFDWENGGSDV
jgi:hypothetical protein